MINITCGIYKITSPTGKVYIGQSINIEKRFIHYRQLHCKRQIRLYQSFLKHGVSNHLFSIIEECDVYFMNERERYWQEQYNVLSKKGLNCILTNTKYKKLELSKEARLKLSFANKGENHPNFGKKWSEEINKRKGRKGKLNPFYGKTHSDELKRKRRVMRSNKVLVVKNNERILFDCVRDCAEFFGCTTKNILYRDKCRMSNKKCISNKFKNIYIEILK